VVAEVASVPLLPAVVLPPTVPPLLPLLPLPPVVSLLPVLPLPVVGSVVVPLPPVVPLVPLVPLPPLLESALALASANVVMPKVVLAAWVVSDTPWLELSSKPASSSAVAQPQLQPQLANACPLATTTTKGTE
jgi:hypothetical protein